MKKDWEENKKEKKKKKKDEEKRKQKNENESKIQKDCISVFCFVLFNGISTIVGNSMPNLSS